MKKQSFFLLLFFPFLSLANDGETDSLSMLFDSNLDQVSLVKKAEPILQRMAKKDLHFNDVIEYGTKLLDIAYKEGLEENYGNIAELVVRANYLVNKVGVNQSIINQLNVLWDKRSIKPKPVILSLGILIKEFIENGDLERAGTEMEYLYRVVQEANDPKLMAFYYAASISYETEFKNYDKAFEDYQKQILLIDESKNLRNQVVTNYLFGEFCKTKLKDYALAEKHFSTSKEIAEEHNMIQKLPRIYGKLAQLALEKNEGSIFNSYLNKIENIIENNESNYTWKDYYFLKGNYSLSEKQYDSARKHYQKALSHLDSTHNGRLEIYEKLYENAIASNNYNAALKYMELKSEIENRKSEEQNLRSKNYFDAKYALAQKENEASLLQAKISQDRLMFSLGVLLILFALAFLAAAFIRNRKYNKSLKNEVKLRTNDLSIKNSELVKNLSELEAFNHIASHDIKEPMRVVGTMSSLIEKNLDDKQKEQNKEYFDLIKSNIQQLYTLLEDISIFTSLKKQKEEVEEINVEKLIQDIKGLISQQLIGKKVSIDYKGESMVHSRKSLLTIILKNLIENGIKYNDKDHAQVIITLSNKQDSFSIEVEDNGIGIEEKYTHQIFDMFKRIEGTSNKTGSGMGLGIVKMAIEKLKGRIELASKLGEGSKFTIHIPFAA